MLFIIEKGKGYKMITVNPMSVNHSALRASQKKEAIETNAKPQTSVKNIPAASKLGMFTVAFKAQSGYLSTTDTAELAKLLTSSTSGYRADLTREIDGKAPFTRQLVNTITDGAIVYAKRSGINAIIIGGDTKQATTDNIGPIAERIMNRGINVITPGRDGSGGIKPIATPMLALANKEYGDQAPLGILLTSSHNPWTDGGYNFTTSAGAIAPASVTEQIGQCMNDAVAGNATQELNSDAPGTETTFDPLKMYDDHVTNTIDIDWGAIKGANINIYYDGLQGTGGIYFPELLGNHGIQLTRQMDSQVKEPDPTKDNLQGLISEVKADTSRNLTIGLSNDGDSDRFGVIDEKGNFITPNDVLLLTAHHLVENKGQKGIIIKNHATSAQLDAFAEKHYGITVMQTPVGFKYIGAELEHQEEHGNPVLLAGEESGGLTIHGHIPEKDGFLASLMMLEMMAMEEKPLSQILSDVKKGLGKAFSGELIKIKLNNAEDKDRLINELEPYANGEETHFADMEIDADKTAREEQNIRKYKEQGDGIKLYFTDGSFLLARKSGTESFVKIVVETTGSDKAEAAEKFQKVKSAMDRISAQYTG